MNWNKDYSKYDPVSREQLEKADIRTAIDILEKEQSSSSRVTSDYIQELRNVIIGLNSELNILMDRVANLENPEKVSLLDIIKNLFKK